MTDEYLPEEAYEKAYRGFMPITLGYSNSAADVEASLQTMEPYIHRFAKIKDNKEKKEVQTWSTNISKMSFGVKENDPPVDESPLLD